MKHHFIQPERTGFWGGRRGNTPIAALFWAGCLAIAAQGQVTQPIVAIHDSELTRALDSSNAVAVAPTPAGPGTTGLQWWPTNWHYFVMPEAVQEALRSDGTVFTVVGDSNIAAGLLLTNGLPKYPIMISLACEALRDDEIAPLTNYVAAGGFLLVGSSAFTRNTNGTPRGDFAFANELGLHMATSGLTNWIGNSTFTKQLDHRLVSHIPDGTLVWNMPSAAEEISWGTSPHPTLPGLPHLVWQVQASDATVIVQGNASPFLAVKPFGKGYFIYHSAMQPLIGHGGWAPGMYAYVIFRRVIEWAFESAKLPVPKLSPWPYAYDAAFTVRHDLENYTNAIANIAASALVEYTNGVKGDYYFCTGTLRDDAASAYDTNALIAGLRLAVSNYGATIGSHNGGLRNPRNPSLVSGQYDYWHWGPDEALDTTPTNYPDGKTYAFTSMSNSFLDIETWLPGLTNGLREWVGCYFNATREDSYEIQEQLGVNTAGEQKLSPFPHWTLSTRTSGKRYPFLTEPVSDWYVSTNIAQSLEPWHLPFAHTFATVQSAVDFYYGLGALINLYSHTLATGQGDAGQLMPGYIAYCLNTNLHPRLWSANAAGIYQWWRQRSNAQVSVSYTANGSQSKASIRIAGATHPDTSVELLLPDSALALDLQVLTNGVPATGDSFRINGEVIKVRVGASVTNVQIGYVLCPRARSDVYATLASKLLNVPPPGVLTNDSPGRGTNLTAFLVNGPAHGSLHLNPDGGFSYLPEANFNGIDDFTYQANDGITNSNPATVGIMVGATDLPFWDDFVRPTDPGPSGPWVAESGSWTVTGGVLQGSSSGPQRYSFICITNNWTNYAVQARIQFPPGAYGGGLGGRLDPVTGAHYAAWIYPEGSPGASNELKLVKFQNWTSFSYANLGFTPMQQVSLAAVGTNWHTLKLGFQGNQIAVYYDSNQVMSVTDVEPEPYVSGGISIDMWTAATPYTMPADNIIVSPLAAADSYGAKENSALTVTAPGVLVNDTEIYGTNLIAVLVNGPTNGTLTLNADGSFIYLPATNYLGADSFAYQAMDGQTNLGTATVGITILAANSLPVRIQAIDLSGGMTTITWNTVIGYAYRLQYKDTLTGTNWSDLPPNVLATGLTATATNAAASSTQRFYRVLLLP